MQVLEIVAENKTIEWAKEHHFIAVKVKFVEAGYPDRLFISPFGDHIWIEFKRVGEKPEPIQVYRIEVLVAKNVHATWTDNYDDAVAYLTPFLEPPRLSEKGDEASFDARRRRAFSRSRIGKNLDLFGYLSDSQDKGAGEEDASNSASKTHAEGVA